MTWTSTAASYIEERHGFAGALPSAGGLGGPSRAPHLSQSLGEALRGPPSQSIIAKENGEHEGAGAGGGEEEEDDGESGVAEDAEGRLHLHEERGAHDERRQQ